MQPSKARTVRVKRPRDLTDRRREQNRVAQKVFRDKRRRIKAEAAQKAASDQTGGSSEQLPDPQLDLHAAAGTSHSTLYTALAPDLPEDDALAHFSLQNPILDDSAASVLPQYNLVVPQYTHAFQPLPSDVFDIPSQPEHDELPAGQAELSDLLNSSSLGEPNRLLTVQPAAPAVLDAISLEESYDQTQQPSASTGLGSGLAFTHEHDIPVATDGVPTLGEDAPSSSTDTPCGAYDYVWSKQEVEISAQMAVEGTWTGPPGVEGMPHSSTAPIGVLLRCRQAKALVTDAITRLPDPVANTLRLDAYSLIAACVRNAEMIGVDVGVVLDLGRPQSPSLMSPLASMLRSLGGRTQLAAGMAAYAHLDPDMRPCARQLLEDHDIYVDLFPLPGFRERIMALRSLRPQIFDEKELIADLDRGGLVCWGTPWAKRSWEARPWFLHKWWMLLGARGDMVVENSRWFREQRGERAHIEYPMSRVAA